jgi:hypothetical protein
MKERQGGTMNRKNTITALVVAIATAAVFTSSAAAMAKIDNGAVGSATEMTWVSNGHGGVKAVPVERASEIPYLSQGFGVTREAPAIQRSAEIPYLSHGVSITREAPAAEGTPIFRDQPDGLLPRGETVEVSVAAGSSVDWSEILMGFGFGLGLAMLGALGVLALRHRTLRTQ